MEIEKDMHGSAQRLPFREGEPVLIIDVRGKEHLVRLRAGSETKHGRGGRIRHDTILGRAPGLRLISEDGNEILCLRLTLEDYLLKRLKRRTQIIYPKDLGAVLIQGNIYPGARVLEAGMGSAAAALVLGRFLGKEGRLVSYEKRDEFLTPGRETIEEFRALYGGSFAHHEIHHRDVYEGIDEVDLDAILLDVPEPVQVTGFAVRALRPNGTLLCWLPTALQVFDLVRHLQQQAEWGQIETTESLVRPWEVGPRSIRPALRMVGHTGFLVTARRLEILDLRTLQE